MNGTFDKAYALEKTPKFENLKYNVNKDKQKSEVDLQKTSDVSGGVKTDRLIPR